MLRLGGVDLTSVAADFGTPTFVLDVEAMRGRARVWASAMAEEFWDGYGMNGGDAFYAGKAFLSADVARLVAAEGLGIDTASLGELSLALRAGVDPDRIGLHGNNKSDAEIRLALEAGIHRIFIDSMDEVHQIERIAADLGVVAPVMVRLKSGIHAGGNEYIATAHEDQKFGLSLATDQAYEAVAVIKDAAHLDFRGLHSHIGSQIFGTEAFAEAARIVIDFAALLKAELGLDVPAIDLGGGVGIAYTGQDPVPTSPVEVARALATVVRERCAHHGLPIPHVSVEPGRSIAGPSMVMLYRVGVVKDISLEDGECAATWRSTAACRITSARCSTTLSTRRRSRTATLRRPRLWRAAASSASTARAATSSSVISTCRPTLREATCWPFPLWGRTATRWPRTTTC